MAGPHFHVVGPLEVDDGRGGTRTAGEAEVVKAIAASQDVADKEAARRTHLHPERLYRVVECPGACPHLPPGYEPMTEVPEDEELEAVTGGPLEGLSDAEVAAVQRADFALGEQVEAQTKPERED